MAAHIGKSEMLIRRPVSEVFNAFVDPATITKFWLEGTSAPLSAGARVEWRFMVPGAKESVAVTAFDSNRRIAFEWSSGMHVEMTFVEHAENATRLAVEVSGFPDGAIDQIVGATEGFIIVLCDLKTLLESGRSAQLVKDKAELIAAARA